MECNEERDRQLTRLYHQYISTHHRVSMPELYEFIANAPAPRFYVSEARAVQVVASIIRRKERYYWGMRNLKRQMFMEILHRATAMMIDDPTLTLAEAVRKTVRRPAPKFYMSTASVKACLCKLRKEWKDKKIWKIPS